MIPEPYRGTFELPASEPTVFAHLTSSELLPRWWPNGAETDPVSGGAYHFWWDGPGWHLRGEYLEVEPPTRLVFTWTWDHKERPARRVEMNLEIAGSGSTQLDIEHDTGSEEEQQEYREAWEFFMAQLRDVLSVG